MITYTETSNITVHPHSVCEHPTLPYLVRSDGYVWNVQRLHTNTYRGGVTWTQGWICSNGYYRVQLGGKKYLLHVLIAQTFLPNPLNKPTVDHINRIRTDNRVENLRWATRKEQADNTANVESRLDYGIRECENRAEYSKRYYEDHKAHYAELRKIKKDSQLKNRLAGS